MHLNRHNIGLSLIAVSIVLAVMGLVFKKYSALKKMVYCIIAAVIVLACICILIVRGLSMNNNNVLDGDGMINPMAIDSFTYRRGGGSLCAGW